MSAVSPRHVSESRRLRRPDIELLGRLGREIQPDDPALVAWFAQYGREHVERLAADLVIIENHVPAGCRLLEYGSIPLLMTAALSDRGYAVRGLDIAPERFAGAIRRRGLDVSRCDVETEAVPFGDQVFDAVLFNELFEHLRINPIFTMREVHRVLKPGGTLLLSTPNLRSLRGLRNLVVRNLGHAASADVYRQYEKLETLGHMGHVREYTTREVSEFLARVGFTTRRLIFRGGYGAGVVGLAERLLPSLRPAFTLVATRDVAPEALA